MNNCYMKKNQVRREYFYEITDYEEDFTPEVDRVGAFVDRMFNVLGMFLSMLLKLCAKPAVRRVIRYAGVALCFFCFLGLVGGIEQGLISAGLGVVAGLLLIFVEIFCLR
ncbi:MAG: hypothetical protein IJW40_11210 [Clostridia bacterium]|nr:hypothetical protein [Clostridia bacterium]